MRGNRRSYEPVQHGSLMTAFGLTINSPAFGSGAKIGLYTVYRRDMSDLMHDLKEKRWTLKHRYVMLDAPEMHIILIFL